MKRLLLIIVAGALALSFQQESRFTPCELSFSKVNDSTYVLNNGNSSVELKAQVVLGLASTRIEGDTIYIVGKRFVVSLLADNKDDCHVSKVVNKLK